MNVIKTLCMNVRLKLVVNNKPFILIINVISGYDKHPDHYTEVFHYHLLNKYQFLFIVHCCQLNECFLLWFGSFNWS